VRFYRRYLTFERTEQLVRVLDRFRIPHTLDRRTSSDIASTTIEFKVFEDEPDFVDKTTALAQLTRILHQEGTEFTPEELEGAPWFWLTTGQTGYPQPDEDWFGNTYARDTSCGTCGCAGEQVAPFRFTTEPEDERSAFLGLNWVFDAIFVRDEAKALLEAAGITGVRFSRPVIHRSGAPLTTIWQMEVPTTLPEGVSRANLHLERCNASASPSASLPMVGPRLVHGPFCARDRYNYPTRDMLRFHPTTFDGAPEVVRTKEWFGSGGSSSRPVLVSRRAKEVVEAARLSGAYFKPVGVTE
jgi:hypothetical protein